MYPFIVTPLTAALASTALVIGADVSNTPLGITSGVLAAVSYSIYLLIGNRVMRAENPLAAATVTTMSAEAVFCVVALIERPVVPQTMTTWVAVVAIAVVSTAIPMVALFNGIRHLGAADAATLSTLEPVVTALLAAAFFGENLGLLQWIGGLIIIILVAVIALARYSGTVKMVRVK